MRTIIMMLTAAGAAATLAGSADAQYRYSPSYRGGTYPYTQPGFGGVNPYGYRTPYRGRVYSPGQIGGGRVFRPGQVGGGLIGGGLRPGFGGPILNDRQLEAILCRDLRAAFGGLIRDVDVDADCSDHEIEIEVEVCGRNGRFAALQIRQFVYTRPYLQGYRIDLDIDD